MWRRGRRRGRLTARRRRGQRRRRSEWCGGPWLCRLSRPRRLSRRCRWSNWSQTGVRPRFDPGLTLVRSLHGAPEDRHHDEPSFRQLVVADDRITVGPRFTDTAEPREHGVRGDRPVQDLPGRVESLSFLRKHHQLRIHGLHDVIGTDPEAVVRRVPRRVGG